MIRKTNNSTITGMMGGKGSLEIREILPKKELMGHGTLYAHVVIHPHSSIGYHQHIGNTEPYYILSGHGVFEDNSHALTEVGPGDVCLIRCGESHGLENPHDEPLEIMALVLNMA